MKCLQTLKARFLTPILAIVFATGCQTSLTPAYDQALFDGITSANTDLMTFLASISDGTSASDYDTRSAQYSNLIGRVDALSLQSKSRPMPSSKLIDRINAKLNDDGKDVVMGSAPPSVGALEGISKALNVMNTQDKANGLTATEVVAFKNNVSIYLDQALTYESFLHH